jgi:2'-5' RNA ligase
MAESAFAVNVPEAEPYVGSLRERLDPAARLGVPAHITVLYPFLPPEQIDAGVLGSAALALASTSPFAYRLARIARFPGVAYLAPEPAAPFIALTESLVRRFPRHLPYEGRYDSIVPHLTVGQGSDAASEEAAGMLAKTLPREGIEATCREVVLIENSSGIWKPMHVFSLIMHSA